jgi:hypothetical protein
VKSVSILVGYLTSQAFFFDLILWSSAEAAFDYQKKRMRNLNIQIHNKHKYKMAL